MTKELKDRLQREYPDIQFFFEGIDDIPLELINRIEYAKCRRPIIDGVPSKTDVRIYVTQDTKHLAYTPEEIEAVCYHEIGHAVLEHGCHLPIDSLYQEYSADRYAIDRIGWKPVYTFLSRAVKQHPENSWIQKRMIHIVETEEERYATINK